MLVHSVDVTAVNVVAQLIQLSVAPVFLLAAVGALLNVFTGRLSRIIDKIEKFDQYGEEVPKSFTAAYINARRDSLAERMRNMNLAIFFCTVTGLLVAIVIVTMFLSAMLEFEKSLLIAALFILAMVSLILSLTLFLREIFLTTAFARK
jgi:magnesium-transporting ATPase (P-type)